MKVVIFDNQPISGVYSDIKNKLSKYIKKRPSFPSKEEQDIDVSKENDK